jgi:hypothetical protein
MKVHDKRESKWNGSEKGIHYHLLKDLRQSEDLNKNFLKIY